MRGMFVAVCLALGAPSGSAAPPARVVAVGGAVTEMVYALGAGTALVGADSTSVHPSEAARLPRVGYMRQLSAEGVLSLRPALVLATAEAGPPAVLEQIRGAGVRLERLHVRHSPDAVRENIRTIAAALGRDAAGDALLQRFDADWRTTRRRVAAMPARPRVLFVMAHGGAPMVGGRDTAADAMLELAGAVNAASGITGYKPLTAEAALAAAPDVILVTDQALETGGIDALLQRPGLALTPAGRAKRVATMDAVLLLGFGPRLPQAVDELATKVRAW
jgi:iron complex transport system substrate-binding protein